MVSKSYRDKIYIIKDIIALLVEYGELNQTTLVSYCGLNLKKHKKILDNLESHGFISKSIIESGKRTVTIYKATNKGVEFCRTIIEPYEELFPRTAASDSNHKLGILIII
ncbi:MAG: winged helix-turn-helix domain-containing protein [Candidatus Nitrosotenuis sp.]